MDGLKKHREIFFDCFSVLIPAPLTFLCLCEEVISDVNSPPFSSLLFTGNDAKHEEIRYRSAGEPKVTFCCACR